MRITKHASKRMKERCGIGKKTQEKVVKRAFNDGIKHSETKGNLNKWITSQFFKNTNANNMRLYGETLYVFAGDTLITAIPVPSSLRKNMMQMVKREGSFGLQKGLCAEETKGESD